MGTYNTTLNSNGKVTIKLVENSTDVPTNTSNVTVTVQYTSAGQYYLGISSLTITDNSGATVYSFSRSYGVVSGISKGTVTLDTKTFTAAHASNGTGSLAISITYRIRTSTNYTETFTDTLSTIPRAAALSLTPSGDLTISSTSGNIGYSFYSYASFYYKLTYKFGNISQTTITIGNAGAGVTKTGNIRSYTQLLAALPNTTSGAFTATLDTYTDSTYGTLVGSSSASKSVSININSIKPSIAWNGNIVPNTTPISGYLIAGHSTAKLQYNTTAASGAGTTTTSFSSSTVNLSSSSSTSLSGTITTATLPTNGSNYTFSIGASVRDSRGATATITAKTSPTVYGYIAPSISGTFYRTSNSSGTPVADEAGTYVYCSFSSTVGSSINSQNTIQSTTCSYTGSKSGTVTSGGYVSLAENQYLTFTVTATDKVTSSSRVFSVGTATFPLDLYQEGAAVGAAIGGVAEAGKFNVYLPTTLTKETTIKDIFKIDIKGSATNYDTDGYREVVVNVSTAELKEKDSTLTSSSGDTQWLTALLKVLVEKYPLGQSVLYRGKIYPNSYAFYSIFIYSTNELSSGLPKYAFGWWQHFYNFYQVGTNNYAVFLRGVSSVNYTNVSNGTTAATYRPALVPTLNGDSTVRATDNLYIELGKASDQYSVFAIGKSNTRGYLRLFDHASSYYAQIRPIGGLTANHTYDLPNVNGTIALTSQLPTTGTASSVFTRTGGLSGSTCDYAHLKRYGNVVTIYAKFTCATQAGTSTSNRDIFTGTMNSANYPPYDVEAFAYYGTSAIGLRITPQGAVTVRNASGGSVTIADSIFFSVTYVR